MITSDAPDPRDLYWSNFQHSLSLVENRKIIVQVILLICILCWSAIVGAITFFTNTTFESIALIDKVRSFAFTPLR